jgi:hypothetical protein
MIKKTPKNRADAGKNNHIKNQNDDFRQSLFLLRTFYSKNLEILEAFMSGYIAVRNTVINNFYTILSALIDNILNQKGFEDLKKEKPELFESLIGDLEISDMWEFVSPKAYDFLGKIEKNYILACSPIFELPKEMEILLKKSDEAIIAHKEFCRSEWEKIKPQFEKQATIIKEQWNQNSNPEPSGGKTLTSIHLITQSVAIGENIFLVLDGHFESPIRFATHKKDGSETTIKKLHNIAYMANAPRKRVEYSKRMADNINNGLFRNKRIAKYIKTNNFIKPTLVQKSESGILVLKNDIVVKIMLVNTVPSQYQSLYIDKTN